MMNTKNDIRICKPLKIDFENNTVELYVDGDKRTLNFAFLGVQSDLVSPEYYTAVVFMSGNAPGFALLFPKREIGYKLARRKFVSQIMT